MQKKYPTSTKEWLKYLTIDNYYSLFQIEHRKHLIDESGCDYIMKAKAEVVIMKVSVNVKGVIQQK